MTKDTGPSRERRFLAAVGEQILNYREAAGLSQVDVAKATGLSARQIDEIEHGWSDIKLSELGFIAAVLGTTASELLDVGGSELGFSFGSTSSTKRSRA